MHLGNVSKNQGRMEVCFDVCLLENNYFRTEQVVEFEVDTEDIFQTWMNQSMIFSWKRFSNETIIRTLPNHLQGKQRAFRAGTHSHDP